METNDIFFSFGGFANANAMHLEVNVCHVTTVSVQVWRVLAGGVCHHSAAAVCQTTAEKEEDSSPG